MEKPHQIEPGLMSHVSLCIVRVRNSSYSSCVSMPHPSQKLITCIYLSRNAFEHLCLPMNGFEHLYVSGFQVSQEVTLKIWSLFTPVRHWRNNVKIVYSNSIALADMSRLLLYSILLHFRRSHCSTYNANLSLRYLNSVQHCAENLLLLYCLTNLVYFSLFFCNLDIFSSSEILYLVSSSFKLEVFKVRWGRFRI